jgi:hypothetical protein
MNIFPKGTPRIGPYASITSRELVSGCISELVFDFEYRCPESGFRNFGISFPKRSVVEILCLEDFGSVAFRECGYFPGSNDNQSLVNRFKIPDS